MSVAPCAASMRDELDDDFERRLVSCLLLDMTQYDAVSSIVKPGDFSSSRARHMFETLGRVGASVRDLQDHVDVLLVARSLQERGELAVVAK